MLRTHLLSLNDAFSAPLARTDSTLIYHPDLLFLAGFSSRTFPFLCFFPFPPKKLRIRQKRNSLPFSGGSLLCTYSTKQQGKLRFSLRMGLVFACVDSCMVWAWSMSVAMSWGWQPSTLKVTKAARPSGMSPQSSRVHWKAFSVGFLKYRIRKRAEYYFESIVSEKRTHWASLSSAANSVSSAKYSVSLLCHTNDK